MSTVRVHVHQDTETLWTQVTRDVDEWQPNLYEVPTGLVEAYEQTLAAFQAASEAIVAYVDGIEEG